MFCQMGRGKRAQLYNVLEVWWSAKLLWLRFLPTLPNLCCRAWSRVPQPWLRITSQPGQQPRHRADGQTCSFLSFKICKAQKTCLSLHLGSGIRGSAHPLPVPDHNLPCDLVSLWKLGSRTRILVPREKQMFRD